MLCDVVSFNTISVPYVQLVKGKLVYACRAVVSVVRCVYTFRNYLSKFLRQSGLVWSAIKCGVTSRNTSTGLLGDFHSLNVGELRTCVCVRALCSIGVVCSSPLFCTCTCMLCRRTCIAEELFVPFVASQM